MSSPSLKAITYYIFEHPSTFNFHRAHLQQPAKQHLPPKPRLLPWRLTPRPLPQILMVTLIPIILIKRRNRPHHQLELSILLIKEAFPSQQIPFPQSECNYSPPHHQRNPLHIPQIQRLRIHQIPPPIRGPKLLPPLHHLAPLPRRLKVRLPAQSRLVPPVAALLGNLVFHRQRELVGRAARADRQAQTPRAGQVEGQVALCALGGEARAAEGAGVEDAVEEGGSGGLDGEVGDAGAAAHAVI
ncbi:hypothetical protein ACJZ2D_002349 [Fusarium nematophilum]